MSRARFAFAIRINHEDPARATITEDLAACGGAVCEEDALVYCFRTAGRRDEAMRSVRGWAGTRSVEPLDPAVGAEERAALGANPAGGGVPSAPGRRGADANSDRRGDGGGTPQPVRLSAPPPQLIPRFR